MTRKSVRLEDALLERAERTFTRKDLLDATGIAPRTLDRHLRRYLILQVLRETGTRPPSRRGRPEKVYRVRADGIGRLREGRAAERAYRRELRSLVGNPRRAILDSPGFRVSSRWLARAAFLPPDAASWMDQAGRIERRLHRHDLPSASEDIVRELVELTAVLDDVLLDAEVLGEALYGTRWFLAFGPGFDPGSQWQRRQAANRAGRAAMRDPKRAARDAALARALGVRPLRRSKVPE